eukprot:scaffold2191_cov138-Isochrysis_galbana.AAC.7
MARRPEAKRPVHHFALYSPTAGSGWDWSPRLPQAKATAAPRAASQTMATAGGTAAAAPKWVMAST